MMNTRIDDASVHKSTKKSLWPLQIIQNYLHPRARYISSNIIVVGLYFGVSKPDPAWFCFPLIEEIQKIHKAGGFQIEDLDSTIAFHPIITHCSCDLPAKAMCQGMVQYNGKYACGMCLHPGVPLENKNGNSKKSITYRYVGQEITLRTHSDTITTLIKLNKRPNTPVLGFKRISFLIAAPEFDLIHGFNLDYMHCILIGITPKLVSFWLDSKYWKDPLYIKQKAVLNDRIKSIKPPSVINRKPRSLHQKEFFAANEWRGLLLYYLRYSLDRLLGSRFIDHFYLLSSATYILSKKKITLDEIKEAKTMLVKFADDFETLYGKHNVTMNIHLLRHFADSVLQSGPL